MNCLFKINKVGFICQVHALMQIQPFIAFAAFHHVFLSAQGSIADFRNKSYSCLTPSLWATSNESRSLVYPDGSRHSVRIPYPAWASARIVGDIAYILLTEAMGYNAVLHELDTILDQDVVIYAAGCKDLFCNKYDVWNPEIHLTLETSNMGASRLLSLPTDIRPVLLGLLSYDLFDQWYTWPQVVQAGIDSDSHLSLDYYRSYDSNLFDPSLFFDR